MCKQIKNRCKFCKVSLKENKHFHNKECYFKYLDWKRKTKICKIFESYIEAAKYYNRDKRTLKQYEKIHFVVWTELKKLKYYKTCKHCSINKHTSLIGRSGYCKECTKSGITRKYQAVYISKKYKGSGNPNYLHGKSKQDIWQNSKWCAVKKKLPNKCIISNLKNNIDYHHILPRWFCTVSGIDPYCEYNIVPLNHEYHKAVHHLKLDTLLLPNLYFVYIQDALLLKEEFRKQCLSHKLHEIDVQKYQRLDLIQVAKYQGYKKLCNLLPEFLPPFLNQKE